MMFLSISWLLVIWQLILQFISIEANLPTRNYFLYRTPRFRYDESLQSSRNSTFTLVMAAHSAVSDKLTFMQTLTAGAVSRTMAQTIMHPANTYKTILQLKRSGKPLELTPERLLRGADAQFILSLPHGAFYFFVIDAVKKQISKYLPENMNFIGDFASSTISTIICSIVSTPQMVLTDRLMAGVYPSFPVALRKIFMSEGVKGFYRGWWPALAQKIPSYGLTWMFFQQLKRLHEDFMGSEPNAEVNFALGALAAAGAVCVMIPVDTVKTRLVIQSTTCPMAYKGMRDCFLRILKEEGLGAFYLSLPPRLVAVVPMIAIQFGVYELLQKKFMQMNFEQRTERLRQVAANAARNKASQINQSVKKVRSRVVVAREKRKESSKQMTTVSSTTTSSADTSTSSTMSADTSSTTNPKKKIKLFSFKSSKPSIIKALNTPPNNGIITNISPHIEHDIHDIIDMDDDNLIIYEDELHTSTSNTIIDTTTTTVEETNPSSSTTIPGIKASKIGSNWISKKLIQLRRLPKFQSLPPIIAPNAVTSTSNAASSFFTTPSTPNIQMRL